jgi:hypothetical protein
MSKNIFLLTRLPLFDEPFKYIHRPVSQSYDVIRTTGTYVIPNLCRISDDVGQHCATFRTNCMSSCDGPQSRERPLNLKVLFAYLSFHHLLQRCLCTSYISPVSKTKDFGCKSKKTLDENVKIRVCQTIFSIELAWQNFPQLAFGWKSCHSHPKSPFHSVFCSRDRAIV